MTTKYHNKKLNIYGRQFDSLKEANRFCQLRLLERAGEIYDLTCQQKYVLIPDQRVNHKLVERECAYYADFQYRLKDGTLVVEDTKGVRTKDYIIKRKLMLFRFGIQIREI